MKMTIKYTKVLGLAVAATLAFGACSDDWDEHYDVQQVGNGGTLWEAIASDAELSNFAMVLDSCDYVRALNGSQVFTVFAPTNNGLSEQEAKEWIAAYKKDKAAGVKDEENKALKEFVKNHITLYNHSVSSVSNDTLDMLNGKRLPFSTSSFSGQAFTSYNQRYSNGILFKLDGAAQFFHNIFEYLAADSDLDSVAKFLYRYNDYRFVPEMSVEGGIENGQTWYLDSVEVLENDMLESYLGLINDEDSIYRMVVPTNSEWERMVAEYEPYFNYPDNVEKRDSLIYTNARLAILRGTVFSQTVNPSWQDSAVSTNAVPYYSRKYMYGSSDVDYFLYRNPYNAGGAFDGTEEIDCSNGKLLKAAQWNIDKTQTFCQTILAEAESNMGIYDKNGAMIPTAFRPVSEYPLYKQMSNNSALYLVQKTGGATPYVEIELPNVLANMGYDIQLVLVPPVYIQDTLRWSMDGVTDTVPLPNVISVFFSYPNQDGTMNNKNSVDQNDVLDLGETWDKGEFYYTENPGQMDTIMVAENFKFPTCSYGLGSTGKVSLKIRNDFMSFVDEGFATKHLLIDCVILKPHEEGE